jgi:uncharacterized membrane protein
MGFRFQKRVSLGRGLGINLSKSGTSASVRTRSGSIGTRGFSLRTGIPGLSYRGSWGKGGGAFIALFLLAWGVIYLAVKMVAWIILLLYRVLYQGAMLIHRRKNSAEYTAAELSAAEKNEILERAQAMGKALTESLQIADDSTDPKTKTMRLKVAKEKLLALRKLAGDYPVLEIDGLEEAEITITRLESEIQNLG